MKKQRNAGLLLHPTSFPGKNGIGELGAEAYRVLDWMQQAGFTVWQVLPLGPTSYGDSPYACLSAFAGNPLLISLESLVEGGLINDEDLAPFQNLPVNRVDFGGLIPLKMNLLRSAFLAWLDHASEEERTTFNAYCQDNSKWLDDFALFAALKKSRHGRPWNEWEPELRDRNNTALDEFRIESFQEVEFEKWLQFSFHRQWSNLKSYAHERQIRIMGDVPIFVAYDSADVWANRDLFFLDESGNPTVVAGVPPDYFSETGQRWGNPLYNWDVHLESGFAWWIERVEAILRQVDIIRIDHFRGFTASWHIPASEPTAVIGRWVPSPGVELFTRIEEVLGELPFVAEDLGVITEEVTNLRMRFHFPGMRVLQFAFGSGADNPFLPHNHTIDSIVYSGTHDNNTSAGWWEEETDENIRQHVVDYLGGMNESPQDTLIRLAYRSVAGTAIIPLQDVLGLDSAAKMNTPSRESGNWTWRALESDFTHEHAEKMRKLAELYYRI